MWGIDCAASIRQGTPCAWAVAIISFTGFTVPSTLLTCTKLTNFVRSEKSFSYASINSSPLSFMGITFSTIPLRAACNCQGTILLWCSMTETITSSPSFIWLSAKEEANRLILSVVPRVNTISFELRALINLRTVSREASCNSVACWERKCTPRCTLALTE